ncbi:hypothetical protein [Sphingomonas insulae]|uniref:hypothetical protein n=1 Tax=Sphingomonas insulae TaxID=424800 RepID=UPI0013CF5EB9|nr:hypothetical protein [Sphingomonas insulae]
MDKEKAARTAAIAGCILAASLPFKGRALANPHVVATALRWMVSPSISCPASSPDDQEAA